MPHAHPSGFPSLCFGLPDNRGGQAPALRYWDGFFTIAGDRPPRYGIGRILGSSTAPSA